MSREVRPAPDGESLAASRARPFRIDWISAPAYVYGGPNAPWLKVEQTYIDLRPPDRGAADRLGHALEIDYSDSMRSLKVYYTPEELLRMRDDGTLPAMLAYRYDTSPVLWETNYEGDPPRLLEPGKAALLATSLAEIVERPPQGLVAGTKVFVRKWWVSAEEGVPYWALSYTRMLNALGEVSVPTRLDLWEEYGPTAMTMVRVPIAVFVRMKDFHKTETYAVWNKKKIVESNFGFKDGLCVLASLGLLFGSCKEVIAMWDASPAKPWGAYFWVPKALVRESAPDGLP